VPAPVAVEDLLPGEADLDRAVKNERRPGGDDLVVERVALPAEAAAVRRGHDPDVRRRKRERPGERAVEVVGRLRRREDAELAIGIDHRERRVLLDREVRVPLVEEDVLEDAVGDGERALHVAELERDALVDVALVAVVVNPRLGKGERLERIGDGRERLVVDGDQVERGGGFLLARRDHRRDRIADKPHLVPAERVFVLRDRQDPVRDREVRARQDELHARRGGRPRDVDRADPPVRDPGAEELHVEHAREREVVGEARPPRDLRPPVDAPARPPDLPEFPLAAHGRASPAAIFAAAASTASKIWR
jgi:hypothetical protein